MKKRILFIIFLLTITTPAEAMLVNFSDSNKNKLPEDYQVAIIYMMFNGTVGTNSTLASLDEPLVITNIGEETFVINIEEWGIDLSRAGAIFSVSNGTNPESVKYLFPLERFGWGTQVNEVQFGNKMVQIGITEVFRGRTKEYIKLCVVVRKPPTK